MPRDGASMMFPLKSAIPQLRPMGGSPPFSHRDCPLHSLPSSQPTVLLIAFCPPFLSFLFFTFPPSDQVGLRQTRPDAANSKEDADSQVVPSIHEGSGLGAGPGPRRR